MIASHFGACQRGLHHETIIAAEFRYRTPTMTLEQLDDIKIMNVTRPALRPNSEPVAVPNTIMDRRISFRSAKEWKTKHQPSQLIGVGVDFNRSLTSGLDDTSRYQPPESNRSVHVHGINGR